MAPHTNSPGPQDYAHDGRHVGSTAWLTRTKARHELIALAGRDSDLASTINDVATRFEALQRTLIAQWQPAGANPTLIDQQAFTVGRFITGVMHDFVRAGNINYTVEHINHAVQAILWGVQEKYREAQNST